MFIATIERASKFTLAKKHCPTFFFVRDCMFIKSKLFKLIDTNSDKMKT
jgi:hypothetical protein